MDSFLFHLINQYAARWAVLDFIGVFCAKYLEYFVIFLLFLFLVERFAKNWKTVVKAFVSAVLARFVIVNLTRFLWYRPRPFVSNAVNLLMTYSDEPSFPSGHAAFYFALSTIVFYKNKEAGLLFFLLSFFICLGRVFVGIHWPSDIFFGAIIGALSGWLVNKIAKG